MQKQTPFRIGRIGLAILCTLLLVACGSSGPSQADIDATVAAGIQATTSAGQASAPSATISAPTVNTATLPPTSAPEELPSATASAPESAASATAEPNATAEANATATSNDEASSGAAPDEAAPEDDPLVFQPVSGEAASTVNIELVFDSSGSMAEDIGGETKIAAAQRAIEQVVAQLPDDAPNFNVGFRVFGHLGDNTDAGRAVSCQSTELIVPLQGIDKALLVQKAGEYQPVGWTPITLALQKAAEDLQAGENTKNVIIMVTDGEETCDGDPCAVSTALAQSEAEVRIDVVGFGLTPDVADTLRCIGENSGGTYTDAQDGDALTGALEELIAATVQRSYLRVVAVGQDGQLLGEDHPWQGVIEITGLTDAQGNRAPIEEGLISGEGQRTPLIDLGEQRFELAPGDYTMTVQQVLGYNNSTGDLPLLNNEQSYQIQIVEGQETVATIGVGALFMTANGGEPEYACDLQLEVASAGSWQPAYPAVDGFCSRDGNIVQGAGLAFDRDYPLLRGRYRVADVPNNRVLVDDFLIEPGKTVKITVEGLPRSE